MKSIYAVLFALVVSNFTYAQDCSQRPLTEESGQLHYEVGPRAPTLYMISRDLYGSDKFWKQLARANGMSEPYRLEKGQKLLITKKPTIDNNEANSVLTQAWEKLGKPEMANCLKKPIVEAEPEPAPATETLAEPLPPPVIGQTIPPEVVSEEVPPPPSQEQEEQKAEEKTEEHIPPERVEAEEEDIRVAHKEHHGWHTSLAAALLMFKMESEDHNHDVTKVDSELSYALDIGAHYFPGGRWGFSFITGVHLARAKATGDDTIENNSQSLFRLTVGTEYRVMPAWHLLLNARYNQQLFVRPVTGGFALDYMFVPEASLGTRVRLYHTYTFHVYLAGEWMYYFPAESSRHDAEAGSGYQAAIHFEHKLKDSAIFYGPAYVYRNQDTDHAKEHESATVFHAGLHW